MFDNISLLSDGEYITPGNVSPAAKQSAITVVIL